jgi:hypothetical protein
MKLGLVALGIGLGVLFILGLAGFATPWMAWLDCGLAIASLLSVVVPDEWQATLRSAPSGIAVALLAVWIAGLASRATPWLTWWNFVFAVAYGALALTRMALPDYRGDLEQPHHV